MAGHAGRSPTMHRSRERALRAASGCARGLIHAECAAEQLEPRILLAAVMWDGGGDGSSWSDPANWSGDRLPRPRDVVVIGADASINIGGKGERITVRRLESQGSLTLLGGSLRTRGAMLLDGEINVLANSTLAAGKRFHLGAVTQGDGARLVLRGGSIFVDQNAHISGLSRFSALAPDELWFAGSVVAPMITLDGGDSSRTIITGLLDASNQRPRDPAGSIHVFGGEIYVHGATIDARGRFDGGQVRIGGDYSGQGDLPRAQRVYIDADTVIRADSKREGDGGTVIVWSDARTIFDGRISASAGRLGGDGGLIETSSKGLLSIRTGLASALARRGEGGLWLLDPYDILIANTANFNITITPGDPTVFMATGAEATVSTASITAALNTGTSVTITTEGDGGGAGDIFIFDDIIKTAGGAATLTFNADRNVTLNANISSSSGLLDVVVQAGGAFDAPVGSINTNGGLLHLVGNEINLGVTASLAAGDGQFVLVAVQNVTLLGTLNTWPAYGVIESIHGNINANTSISAAGVQLRAYEGSVQVSVIEAATLVIEAADNITFGTGSGGLITAYSFVEAHAGRDGTGSVLFNPLVEVHAWQVRLRAGDGTGGAGASASVNVIANSPFFRSTAGGATSPEFFTIRQDGHITDAQIPGPASFGGGLLPQNISLRSDDGDLTIGSAAKVAGVDLSVGTNNTLTLGSLGNLLAPARLFFDVTPSQITISTGVNVTMAALTLPADVVLGSISVSLQSNSTISIFGTVNGAGGFALNSPGLKSLTGAVGNTTPPSSLQVVNGSVQFFDNVTAGIISIGPAATIFNSVTMTATSSGPFFGSTLSINGSAELHIRGVSPAFLGGSDSVSGSGILSIAPASNAATMEIGGAFLAPTDIAAIAQGFTRVEFGSGIQDGPVIVVTDTFRNPTRFLVRNGLIYHNALAFTAPGAGVTFAASGFGYVIANGNIETRGGVIEVDAPFVVNTSVIYLNTTQFGADAGADIRLLAEVLAGDGLSPSIEFRLGALNTLTLAAGIGTEYEPFNSMIVYDGAAARTWGDLWLGSQLTSGLGMGAPFEIAADVLVWVSNASFLHGIRTFGGAHSLTMIGGGDVEIHGTTMVENLEVHFSDGTTHLNGNVIVGNFALFNTILDINWYITISASTLSLIRPVSVNDLSLELIADHLNIGSTISPGGPNATLSISARTPSQTVSLADLDEGLWLTSLALPRILDGFALIRFGSLDATGTLYIGNATFLDPVQFVMAGPGGRIVVNGPLSGVDNASFMFIGAGSTTVINGDINTDAAPLIFDDAVIIAADVTLNTVGGGGIGGDIEFYMTVDSETGQTHSLTLAAGSGTVRFFGAVGGAPGGVLGSLTVIGGGGQALVAGGLVSTMINQTWNRQVVLGNHTVLSGGTGSLNINAPIVAGPFDLTLQADTININGALSGSGNLRIEPFTNSRDVYIYSVPLGGALFIDPGELDNIEDGWESVTYGKEGGDAQMVVGGGDYPDPTRFVMDGDSMSSSITIAGEVSGTGNGTITIRGGGSTTHLWANIRTQGNAITILDRVILHGLNLKLDSTFGGLFPIGGKIEVHDDIDSQPGMERSLEIDAGDDEIELFGKIGDRFDSRLGQFITGLFSRAILRGGIIKTIGQQLYQGPVFVPQSLLLSTLGAPIIFEDEVVGDENLTIGDGTGETTFNDESNFESLTIEFGSTRTFNGTVNIGTLTVLGGIVNFNADGKIGDGILVAGTLSGTATIFIDGEFDWAGGLVEGDGLLVVRPGGVFSFGGASERTLARDIEVLGSLLWTSGHLFLRSATVFILPGGVFEVRSSGTMLPAEGADGALDNDGLIIRESPGAAAFVGLAVTNTGEIRIADGSLKITPDGGTFTNNGLIDLGPAGSLIVRGDYIQAAGATLAIRIAGTGVAEFGRLIVLLGGAALGGTVSTSFVNGFVPQAGGEFRFLQSVTRTDVFAIENLEPPPPNLRADIEYDPDGARLVISPGLRADSDNDGHLTVQDIFHFLTQWFAGNADFDGDGQTTIDDLFAFLASWFAG
ncbi:MAG: hypothetical protein KF699_03030 [Phycisphaeraceae bacterium]|nr:hypothetical protein [Phycisphaeraceae bacterium]